MKLFISDYDGTYLRPKLEKEEQLRRNAVAVDEWQLEEGLFGFSTGRILPLMELELKTQVIETDFMIVANGALVLDSKGETIFHQVLDSEVANEVVSYLIQEGNLNFICSNGKDGYHTEGVVQGSSMTEVFITLKEVGCFNMTLEEALRQGVSQFSIVDLTPEEVEPLAAKMESLFGDRLRIYPNRSSIDLSPIGISKATGIQHVLDYFNLTPDQVICMGDSWNDVEMIQKYQGLTVPEAPAVLRRAAKKIFSTVEEALKWAKKEKDYRK